MSLLAQFQSQLQGRVPSPRNQLPFCSPNKEYGPQNTALFCCLTYFYVIASQGVEVYKCLEKDTKYRVSISNLSEPQG